MSGPPIPSTGPRPAGDGALNARTEALLRRLVRRDASAALKKVIAKTRPEDIAASMRHLTYSEQRRLYWNIDDTDVAAEVLSYLPDESSREITKDMAENRVVELLERMEPDDATDVVGVLPDDLRMRVLGALSDDETG